MHSSRLWPRLLLIGTLVLACSGQVGGSTPDAGSPGDHDSGVVNLDGGDTDSDAGIPDAGSPDAGSPDAGAPDAGAPDAGTTIARARIFFSGHSLLDNPMPDYVESIAKSQGKDLLWNQQNIIGSPLRVRTWGNGNWEGTARARTALETT
jgi:hypothetical protein